MDKSVPVIVSQVRTAIGSFGGALKDIKVVDLGSVVIKEVLERAGVRPSVAESVKALGPDNLESPKLSEIERKYMEWDPELKELEIDEVIMGHVIQGGQGQNTARQVAIKAGIPQEVNAFTVNKVCASGMKAVALAAQAIIAGEAESIVAGGMENMSQAPYVIPDMRWGARMFDKEVKDLMVFDGLYEIFYDYHMGITAENIAKRYGFSRIEQDKLGAESHQRALEAIERDIFLDEIVPVKVPGSKGETETFEVDERPMETSVEKMEKLPPVFKKDGTVTAGNASGINDAAAALLITSKTFAEENDIPIRASIGGYATGGVDPKYMGLGPIPAVRKLFKKTRWELKDMDLIELNEAFAVQALACIEELGLDEKITNVHGSGIALGHPIGCTGARILVTLLHELERSDKNLGLATLCIGGGQGMAMIIER